MKKLACQRPDLRQYEKEGLPTRFHFSNNRRIEDIVLDMDAGRYGSVSSDYFNNGNHGYDNYFAAMNVSFMTRYYLCWISFVWSGKICNILPSGNRKKYHKIWM